MSINASPEYMQAEREFLAACTLEEKIEKLKKMISLSPSHKGAENLRAQLRLRLSKLKQEFEKEKAKKKGKSVGIKKEGDAQVVIIGYTKSGKSSLLATLTNAKPKISEIPFITLKPEIGTLDLEGIKIQLIELPAYIEDKELLSIARTSDLILVMITSLDELIRISEILKKENITNKKIFILNKVEMLEQDELKKFSKLDVLKVSIKEKIGIEDIKQKIFHSIGLIRIYTKEPGKKPKLDKPLVIKSGSTIKEMAEKIRKDFPERFIKAKVWGQSAKFPGQIVGIEHVLQDKDIVELYIK
ncbi:MAG: TGS domain-containing protein [Candidatus Pacearchaeota archaeon]